MRIGGTEVGLEVLRIKVSMIYPNFGVVRSEYEQCHFAFNCQIILPNCRRNLPLSIPIFWKDICDTYIFYIRVFLEHLLDIEIYENHLL